jgi:hypothetical protein
VVSASEKCVKSKKVTQTFFFFVFFIKTRFCDKKLALFVPKTEGFFGGKARIKICFDHFLDSAYFSDAKTTFGMFWMICFGFDSQTHTLCLTRLT